MKPMVDSQKILLEVVKVQLPKEIKPKVGITLISQTRHA